MEQFGPALKALELEAKLLGFLREEYHASIELSKREKLEQAREEEKFDYHFISKEELDELIRLQDEAQKIYDLGRQRQLEGSPKLR